MKRTSPSVGRIVAILNFLADHPRQRFTLSDIVRALRISPATCHVLLSDLVDAGFLYRAVDKTYVLGGALARIGQVAATNTSELQVAGPEMRALADKFDVICAAVYREGYKAIVRERAISLSHVGWSIPGPETRLSLNAPDGGMFFAWENEEVVEEWLANANYPLSRSQRQELKRRMDISRKRGYVFGIRKVEKLTEENARSLLLRAEQSDYLMGELEPKRAYNLAMLGSPVLVQGKIAFVLVLIGFTHAVSGTFIDETGATLRAACRRIAQLSTRL